MRPFKDPHPVGIDGMAKRRAVLVMACCILGWLVLEARFFQIQIVESRMLSRLAVAHWRKIEVVEARRGTVVDRHGLPLACSVALSTHTKRCAPPGGRLYRRVFPMGPLVGRVLGFVNYKGMGLEGVERRFDALLRGRDGMVVLPRVGNGGVSPYEPVIVEERPTPGEDLRLTLDAIYQGLAQMEARHLVVQSSAKWAGVLLMKPSTGEILAAAVVPPFDPSRPDPGSSSANQLWSYQFEPGSSFKLVVMTAALQHQVVSAQTTTDCENGVWHSDGRNWHDTHPMGKVPYYEAIAQSSNIAAAKLSQQVGADRFFNTAWALGFGQSAGVDLPAETDGFLIRPSRSVSLSAMSMGHEVMVTAVQLLNAYCCVANRGELVQPFLVRRLDDCREASPVVVRQALSPKTARIATELLRGVVDHGTGKQAKHPLLDVAGKTGTAQKAAPGGGGYLPGAYVSTFVGFFPADNPVAAMLIIVDEPQEIYYAGQLCAPAFRRMTDHLLVASGGSLYPELAAMLSTAPRVETTVARAERPHGAPKA